MPDLPESLVLVGAGRMGGALLDGWLKLGLDPRGVAVIDPQPSPAAVELCEANGIAIGDGSKFSATSPAVLVLAIKPQMLERAAAAVDRLLGSDTLLLSILAGKTIANLAALLPQARAVIRAMPNTPAAIGRGISGATPNATVTPEQRGLADALLGAVGGVEWLDDEALLDAVTAVSGSGPAYVFLLAECMAAAGAAVGLPPEIAARLARATVQGAAELMAQSPNMAPATLRENVTSPGGTTAAALSVLMGERGLAPLMQRAIDAATRRGAELSG